MEPIWHLSSLRGKSMVTEVEIEEVCKSIYDELKEDYVGLWSIS